MTLSRGMVFIIVFAFGTASGQEQTPPALRPAAPVVAPSKALSLEERADIFMARKNYIQAVDFYYRALKEVNFKNPTLWNRLGIAYQQESAFASARKAYLSATRINKHFAEAWNNTGTVCFMENRIGKSVKYYRRAIALSPNNAVFHLNLGVSFLRLKRFEMAVSEYDTAIGIDPEILSKQSSLASTVQTRGSGAESYFYLAKAFARKGHPDEAVRYLRRALEEGLPNPKRIERDPDFKSISQYPPFVELMRTPPVAIKD